MRSAPERQQQSEERFHVSISHLASASPVCAAVRTEHPSIHRGELDSPLAATCRPTDAARGAAPSSGTPPPASPVGPAAQGDVALQHKRPCSYRTPLRAPAAEADDIAPPPPAQHGYQRGVGRRGRDTQYALPGHSSIPWLTSAERDTIDADPEGQLLQPSHSHPHHSHARRSRGGPEGDLHIMGALDPDPAAHNRPVHVVHPADAQGAGHARDGTVHLCGYGCRPGPARHGRRVDPRGRQLRLPVLLQLTTTTDYPVVGL